MAYLGLSPEPPQIPEPPERMDYYPPNYPVDKYGYGVHEGEYSTEPPGSLYDPDREQNCARYCDWLASKKAGSFTMDYMERPPGCTCPGESPVVDNKKAGFPVQPAFSTELPMTPQEIEAAVIRELPMTLPAPLPSPGMIQLTPQQIEAQVKQIQPAPAGGALALAAIAALLMLGA